MMDLEGYRVPCVDRSLITLTFPVIVERRTGPS